MPLMGLSTVHRKRKTISEAAERSTETSETQM